MCFWREREGTLVNVTRVSFFFNGSHSFFIYYFIYSVLVNKTGQDVVSERVGLFN